MRDQRQSHDDTTTIGPPSRARLGRLLCNLLEPSALLVHGDQVVTANAPMRSMLGLDGTEVALTSLNGFDDFAREALALASRGRAGAVDVPVGDGRHHTLCLWPIESAGGPVARISLFEDETLAATARFCLDLNDPVLLLNSEGQAYWANPAAERIAIELALDDVAGLMPDHVFNLALALTSSPGEQATVESRRGQRSFRWQLRSVPGMPGLVAQAQETTRQETSRRVLETSVDGIFEIDRQGKPTRVNRAMAHLFGFDTPSAMLARYRKNGIAELFARGADFRIMLEHMRSEGVVSGFESCLRGQDGEEVWALINVRALTDEGGRSVGYAGTLLDITDRRRAQEELKARGGRYRALVQTAGSVILFIDPDGRILEYNREAERVFGYSFMEAAGRNFYDLVFDEDQRDGVEHKIRRMMAGEVIKDVETPFTRKDGERRIFQWNARAHFSEEGDSSGAICIGQDVTRRKSTELALREAEERYRGLFENATEGVFQASLEGRFTDVNPALAELLGYDSPGEVISLIGNLASDFCADPAVYPALLERMEREGEIEQVEVELLRRGGDRVWAAVNGRMIRDPLGRPSHIEGSVVDVTERKKAQERINFLAHHDALTGIPNRMLFQDRLSAAVQRALRGGKEFALFLLDLDSFKQVNDTLGHPIGDLLLQEVAERLQSCIRGDDMVARLGGDEFAIILTNFHRVDDVAMVAERVIERLGRRYQLDGNDVRSGCSVGVCLFPQDAESEAELLRNADLALYCSKTEGRNRYHFFEPKMQQDIQARQALIQDLKAAISNDEMQLYYQPVKLLETGDTVGMEALLRWVHPERGVLQARKFLKVAEESGIMREFGDWVLRSACAQASVWWNSGQKVPVAVNLSSGELDDGVELLARVREALSDFELPPSALQFDISETVLMAMPGDTQQVLSELKSLGVSVAVDDFGAGSSSLKHLRGFPVDVLKITPDFVSELGVDPAMASLVRGIAGLARGMGLTLIAEGVETAAQKQILIDEGILHGQGRLLARPSPVDQLVFGENALDQALEGMEV